MYWLDILNGESRGRRRVQRRVYTAGSDLSCQLWISDAGVAPRHAEFEMRDGGVLARSIDPAAPVLVNGQSAAGGRLLSDGDTIELASTRIRYRARLPLLVRFRSELTSAVLLFAAVGGIGYGAWRYLQHRAGLDRADLPVAAAPVVAAPMPPPVQDSNKLAAMDRLGADTRAAMPAATPPPPAPIRTAAPLSAVVTQSLESVTRMPPTPAGPATTNPAAPGAAVASAKTGTPAVVVMPRPVPAPAAAARAEPPVRPTLTPAPAPIVPSNPAPVAASPAPPPGPEPLAPASPPSTATILAQADALVRAGSLDAAASKLEALLAREPRSMPARAGLARIAEKRGHPQIAERLWTTVLQNSAGDPLYDEAFKELIRIAELQLRNAPPPLTGPAVAPPVPAPVVAVTSAAPADAMPRPDTVVTTTPSALVTPPPVARLDPPQPPPQPAVVARLAPTNPPVATARPQPPARPAPPQIPAVRIARAEMTRFPTGEDREDFRVLQLNLAADEARAPFPAERISVQVVFYDRNAFTGEIVPSRFVASRGRVPLAAEPWNPGDTRTVTVPYAVPKSSDAPAAARFHGYRIRVYAGGRLCDELAKPPSLTSQP